MNKEFKGFRKETITLLRETNKLVDQKYTHVDVCFQLDYNRPIKSFPWLLILQFLCCFLKMLSYVTVEVNLTFCLQFYNFTITSIN